MRKQGREGREVLTEGRPRGRGTGRSSSPACFGATEKEPRRARGVERTVFDDRTPTLVGGRSRRMTAFERRS